VASVPKVADRVIEKLREFVAGALIIDEKAKHSKPEHMTILT
jgi:hypothetical protein